jgi:5-methylcytosine-specific restriction endonuclease McrA
MSKAHGDGKCDIEAHHIIPLRKNIKLSLKVGNGITLCNKCHRLTYGKELNFAKDFKEILNDYTPKNSKE